MVFEKGVNMKTNIIYLEGDLKDNTEFKDSVAIDTETTGLSLMRDRLCVIQIADGQGNIYVVKLNKPYKCPNIKKLLLNKNILKIFHFARFDMAMIKKCLGVNVAPVFCTKIASKLSRTSTDKHSLKSLVKEFFDVELNKDEQTSDWAVDKLSDAQINYAAGDVLYLHKIREILIDKLEREGRIKLFEACVKFLPYRCLLDLSGWEETDIFHH